MGQVFGTPSRARCAIRKGNRPDPRLGSPGLPRVTQIFLGRYPVASSAPSLPGIILLRFRIAAPVLDVRGSAFRWVSAMVGPERMLGLRNG